MGCVLSPSKAHVLTVCHAAVPRPGMRRMGFLKLLTACAFHAAHVTHAGLAALQLPQLAVFGARVHMPLSLASVHGAAIARFLACATRPTARRDVVRDDVVRSWWHPTRELAFSADGSTFVRKVTYTAAVHDTASGAVVSARQYNDTAQLATVAGGVLSGCWTGRAHQCDFLSPTAALKTAVPLIDVASRVEGMCVAGTLLAVCDDRDAHITVFDLQDMTWCLRRAMWKLALPRRVIPCEHPKRLCALYYNNVLCVAATQPRARCVSILCVTTGALLRRVGCGVLRCPLGVVFRASSNELIVADVVRGVVFLPLDDPDAHITLPGTTCAESVALHKDTLLVALDSRVVAALTLD